MSFQHDLAFIGSVFDDHDNPLTDSHATNISRDGSSVEVPERSLDMYYDLPVTLEDCRNTISPLTEGDSSLVLENLPVEINTLHGSEVPAQQVMRENAHEAMDRDLFRHMPLTHHTRHFKGHFEEHTGLAKSDSRLKDTPTEPNRGRERRRKGLPLLFELDKGYEEVMSGHDTGTEANHMSLDLARKLGYDIDTVETDKAQFRLPNGRIIAAIGRVTARVQFAQGTDAREKSITCYFNIFSHLALPVLIGMAFLKATETLTTHTSRLVTLPAGWKRSLRLCAVGSSTNEVTCLLDGYQVTATADTGAEIALISGRYAMRNGLLREYSCEELELADGSLEYTSGFGDIRLTVRKLSGVKTTRNVRFHVLKNLHVDVLLDEYMVEDFKIFSDQIANIVTATTNALPSLGPIHHLRTMERSILETKDKIKNWTSSLLTSKTEHTTPSPSPSATDRARSELQRKIDELDKEELQRRHEERKKKSWTMSEGELSINASNLYKDKRKELLAELQALTT